MALFGVNTALNIAYSLKNVAFSAHSSAANVAESGGAATSTTGSATEEKTSSAVEDFLTYAKMNPVERMRAQYLKDHNLTEEDLAAKSPEERQQIEDDIKKFIQDKIKREAESKGFKLDLVA